MPLPAAEPFLAEPCQFPFCKGCSHTHVLRKLNDALVNLNLRRQDVCLVTDIGCIGLADALFVGPHTVHTTHGRSTAFAAGIAMADSILAGGKLKTIVLIGDGGAMIGLLHLVSGALLNVDMTVLLCNNSLFGMTGGQHSALSPLGFRTPTSPQGNIIPPLDVCSVVSTAHSGYVTRAMATDPDLSSTIMSAISHPGFSLVEIEEICPEHGISRNPNSGKGLRAGLELQGHRVGVQSGDSSREDFGTLYRKTFQGRPGRDAMTGDEAIEVRFPCTLARREEIIIAGSAGERVQSTARTLCRAAAMSGLYCTQKNDNPVTQGSGFSLSEVILSPDPIRYTAIQHPTGVIVVSGQGLEQLVAVDLLASVSRDTIVVADDTLEIPVLPARVVKHPFRKEAGAKRAATAAVEHYIGLVSPIPIAAFREAVAQAS